MKLALVFLVAGAALAAGQNYYLHFAGGSRGEFQDLHASEVDARAPQGVVPPPLLADAAFRSYPYGRYAGYDAGYDAAYFNNINNNNNNNNNNNLGESEPRLFGANVLNLLGITTQTVYRYTATVTSASVTTVTDLCVSLAAGVATPAPACNGAAAGGRRGAGLRSDAGIAPSPPSIDSVEPTAVATTGERRGARRLELASSQDEDVLSDDDDDDDAGVATPWKRVEKRQLFGRLYLRTVVTASVVTSFSLTTTTSPLAGSDWTCLPPSIFAC